MKQIAFLITGLLIITQFTYAQNSYAEHSNLVKGNGKELTLVGDMIEVGEIAPDFRARDKDNKTVKLSDFRGKTVILSIFPAINTRVCRLQTLRFDQEAAKLGEDVQVISISNDKPSQIESFCKTENVMNHIALSDLKYKEFGMPYGFYIKEMKLLTRGIVVIDKDGKVVHIEYVDDYINEPNYRVTLDAVRSLETTFTLHPLPYGADELEPYITEETINFHYGKHLNGYVNNLNKLIENTSYKGKRLVEIVNSSEGGIFNNAAQIFNHRFYFNTLSPDAKQKPTGKLLMEIEKKWGTFEKFKEEFVKNSTSLFGSGWTWLVKDSNGNLDIINTKNAETPITEGYEPLIVFDVWEHAYYLDYQNRRADHVKEIWSIIDWRVAEVRYQ